MKGEEKVRRTIMLSKAKDKRIREIQSDVTKSMKRNVSYSLLVDVLVTLAINDKKTLDHVHVMFGDIKK